MEVYMSRSYKKTPVSGNTGADSDKPGKKIWHKKVRNKTKQILKSTHNDVDLLEDMTIPNEKEVGYGPWVWPKDGKRYLGQWIKNNIERIRHVMGK
jgi:hypothetical protein